MKPIRLAWFACCLVLAGLWLWADPLLSQSPVFIVVRNALVNYTGIVTVGVMSVALMLATRPAVLEPALGGLDKMYRLHKWLGVTALVMAILHWVGTQAPKWLVDLGWLQRSQRPQSTTPEDALLRYLQSQHGLATDVGEWAFYAAVALIVLALVKRFPYRHFFSTHRLLAVVYLALVFHSLILMPVAYWGQLVGPLMAVLMAGGSTAAILVLFRRPGRRRQAFGVVERVNHLAEMKVLEVELQLKSNWAGHAAGQFAFVRFDGDAEPHPFTLSSVWQGDGRLLLLIKELGDYTRSLPSRLHAGDTVRVEGPYGQFNFERVKDSGQAARQIWIGGGIGITPFIARMQHLALHPDGKPVDLIHTVPQLDEHATRHLEHDAQAAGVKLHVLIDARDGQLNGERLRTMVPNWSAREIWFCGPLGMGAALLRDMRAHGLPAAAFHQELFNLR
jgi:predicted ferric reductase